MIDLDQACKGYRAEKPFMQTVYNYTLLLDAKTVFEIGSGHFTFSRAILKALEQNKGHLYTCDPKPQIQYSHPQMTQYPITSDNILTTWQRRIDLLLIDGNHTYHQVKTDFTNFYPYVRTGGLIILHDINVNSAPGVKKLWTELKPHHKIEAELLTWPGLGVIRKL